MFLDFCQFCHSIDAIPFDRCPMIGQNRKTTDESKIRETNDQCLPVLLSSSSKSWLTVNVGVTCERIEISLLLSNALSLVVQKIRFLAPVFF